MRDLPCKPMPENYPARTLAGAPAPSPASGGRPFAAILALLTVYYAVWLLIFWPGVLGEDSLGILLEVQDPVNMRSGKPVFWYYFVKIFYEPGHRVEVPIAVLTLICAVVFSRILAWSWAQGFRKTTAFLLVFVALAPHTVFFIETLYPDGIYSVAVAGLTFEIWLSARHRRLSKASLAMIALTLPFAAFARPNGIIFLVPVGMLVLMVDKGRRRWLGAIVLAWCTLMVGASQAHKSAGHGVLYPLAIYETVNFLQPRPMNLWISQPRVLPGTVEILEKYKPLQTYLDYYDPDYWDPLQFAEKGPRVSGMAKADRDAVVKDFFRYNLWQNVPKFLGSRVNIFFVSAFAMGGMPGHVYAQIVLRQLDTESTYRLFQLSEAEKVATDIYEFSWRWRWLLWTPFLGIALVIYALLKGIRRRDGPLLITSIPMVVQLGAIFIFSIAGEYRYLLPFFMIALPLLPMLLAQRLPRSGGKACSA
ncbi:putative membrane protein DUF2142 [Paracidovorax citrulli]|nr:putative membrane protein DUF2142 [Paracidovorax citrulli]REG66995.1 putative membrane protein DUF2142 [Paracidovorax citrulli]RLJ91555.1 putative membrane protein DUF2142 [Paracidovorax citrulli]